MKWKRGMASIPTADQKKTLNEGENVKML